MWGNYWADVLFAITAAVVAWLWARKRSPGAWVRNHVRRTRLAIRERGLRKLRDQVLRAAAADGARVPISASGHEPTIVTYSDGRQCLFYTNMGSYKHGMQSAPATAMRSLQVSPGRVPVPISRWSKERLKEELEKHPKV